jgi:DNA-directed RNA polymerase
MSAETHKTPFQLQLEELVRVGVGGKFANKENHLKIIQKELEHEEDMLRGGANRYMKTVNDAKAKGQESTTLYGLVLQQKYITEVSKLINEDIRLMSSGKAGNHQTALKIICQCLPSSAFDNGVFLEDRPEIWDTCSLIILKNVIDGISDETTINKLSIQIATGLMQEARITQFKEQNKDSYLKTSRKLAGKNIPQNANRYQYKSRVWTYMMNRNGLRFDDWSNVEKIHLGVKMISYLEKLGLIKHQNRKHRKDKTVTYVEATPKIIEEIKNFNIKNELLFPKYLPMVAPPRDWSSPFTGGYYGKKFNKENKPEEIANALQFHKTNK